MKIKKIAICFLCFIIFSLQIFSQKATPDLNNQAELEMILQKCAEYCEKLYDSALYFVCDEKIKEEYLDFEYAESTVVTTLVSPRGISKKEKPKALKRKKAKNNYVYDYQLIKKGGRVEESRILLEEAGKKKEEKNVLLKTKYPFPIRSVLAPVELLSQDQQPKFSFKLLKEKKLKGLECYVVEATGKQDNWGNIKNGKIWVDKNNYRILKLEIEHKSVARMWEILKECMELNAYPCITTTHVYEEEKNGVMFPSTTIFQIVYIRPLVSIEMKTEKLRTKITYESYRYFTVEVDHNIIKKISEEFFFNHPKNKLIFRTPLKLSPAFIRF